MNWIHSLIIALTGRGPVMRSNRQLMPITEAEAIDLIRVLEGKWVHEDRKTQLAGKLRGRL